jgi:hypothetical protein
VGSEHVVNACSQAKHNAILRNIIATALSNVAMEDFDFLKYKETTFHVWSDRLQDSSRDVMCFYLSLSIKELLLIHVKLSEITVINLLYSFIVCGRASV